SIVGAPTRVFDRDVDCRSRDACSTATSIVGAATRVFDCDVDCRSADARVRPRRRLSEPRRACSAATSIVGAATRLFDGNDCRNPSPLPRGV
ncbi:MAG: hypothetical protein ACM3ZE_15570, partial [Myxococcales bacterium]